MTARRTPAGTPTRAQAEAATRQAKGSVHEASGKLIGDDAVQAHGTAEKEAGAADASDTPKSSRP